MINHYSNNIKDKDGDENVHVLMDFIYPGSI